MFFVCFQYYLEGVRDQKGVKRKVTSQSNNDKTSRRLRKEVYSSHRGDRPCHGNSVFSNPVVWLLEKGNSPHILTFCSLPKLARTVSYKAFFTTSLPSPSPPKKKCNCRHFIINSLFLRNELFSFCSNTLVYFLFPLGPVFMVSAQHFQCQCQHKDRSISSLLQVWQSCFQCFYLEAKPVGQPRCFCNESIDWRKKTDILDINGSLESKHLTWEITQKITLLQNTNWFVVSQRRKNWRYP